MKQAANPYPTESAISSGGSAIFPRDRFIRDKPPVDLNSPRISEAEFNASLLRCRYLEACRQRDLAGRETGWRARIAVTAPYCFRHVLRASAWAKDTLADGVRTIRKLPDIATLCTSADVVSFDVFNTLLYRTVEPPDYLKRLAANYAAQLYAERGYPLTADLFLYLRDESEHRQRRIAQSRGWDTECKLSEVIYEVLFRLFGSEVAEIETATLLEHELKIEVDHLRVVEGVKDLLQNLRSQGKRIIVTSDTYLEPGHLQVIFAQLGIDRWIDAIYASSEHLLGKYSGRLFQTILSAEAIIAARLIHIGDTYESDIRGAVKAGIPAVFLFDIGRLRRRRRLSRESTQIDMVQAKFHKVAPKRAAALPILNSHRNEESELYQIGRDILGPAFTLFVVDVIEESHRVGAADIYYLAREGLLFRELHEILTGHLHQVKCLPPMRHHYLFVSRLATSLPAIRELSQRELHLALYRDRNATLAECISAFGLNPAEFSDLAVDFQNREESARASLFALPEFVARVRLRADAARSLLRGYLSQEGFFNPQEVKLLVDIGWNATIQANLSQAFEDDPEFPMLIGYYFGRRYRHEDYLVSSRSLYMPGRFFDQKTPVGPEHAIGHCLEIFELAAAAPHGATLSYEETDGGIRPVLDEMETDLSDEQRLVQTGILDYALSFVRANGDHEVDSGLLRDRAVERLAQLILRPTLAQTKALRGFAHSLDWGSKRSRPIIAADIGPTLALTPRRFFAALQESYWLEGCMRMSRIPGGLMFLAVARRALRSKEILMRLRRTSGNFFGSRLVSPEKP